jgi:hypothetical protein
LPTLREERRLRVFENRVLRRIFGPRRDEVTKDCKILHNEELIDLYCSPNIVRVVNQHVLGMWHAWKTEMCVYRVLDHLGRPRHRWEDNIKVEFGELGWE